MRALFQRRKRRDLFDLWLGLTEGNANPELVVAAFQRYMEAEKGNVNRQQFVENLAAKREHPGFLSDIVPLLAESVAFDVTTAAELVEEYLLSMLP